MIVIQHNSPSANHSKFYTTAGTYSVTESGNPQGATTVDLYLVKNGKRICKIIGPRSITPQGINDIHWHWNAQGTCLAVEYDENFGSEGELITHFGLVDFSQRQFVESLQIHTGWYPSHPSSVIWANKNLFLIPLFDEISQTRGRARIWRVSTMTAKAKLVYDQKISMSPYENGPTMLGYVSISPRGSYIAVDRIQPVLDVSRAG